MQITVKLKLLSVCPTRFLNEDLQTMAAGTVFLLVTPVDVILPNKIISEIDVLGQTVARNI
jgi:hypothetical protein